MPDKHVEAKWFRETLVFLILYCAFLLCFRVVLTRLEAQHVMILKPEVSQVLVIALIILIYHFFFLGLQTFSVLGKGYKVCALAIGCLITGSILYGFKQWYDAIVNNPFLFSSQQKTLPWYAQEKPKFLLANLALILYFISLWVRRTLMISKS